MLSSSYRTDSHRSLDLPRLLLLLLLGTAVVVVVVVVVRYCGRCMEMVGEVGSWSERYEFESDEPGRNETSSSEFWLQADFSRCRSLAQGGTRKVSRDRIALHCLFKVERTLIDASSRYIFIRNRQSYDELVPRCLSPLIGYVLAGNERLVPFCCQQTMCYIVLRTCQHSLDSPIYHRTI